MTASVLLDILFMVLLVVTIGYAIRLNSSLNRLRKDKDELERLARTFADATTRAEAGIAKLRASAKDLQGDLGRAESLREDLTFLIERGGATADKLEDSVRVSREVQGVPVHGEMMKGEDESLAEALEAELEKAREIGRVNEAKAQSTRTKGVEVRGAETRGGKARGGKAEPSEKGVEPRGFGDEDDNDRAYEAPKKQSEAERELLKALRSVR